MLINTRWFWPTLWPNVWDQPLFNQQLASSSMKYTEDNEVITYSISVPDTVVVSDIEASFDEGVLTLVLPKQVEKPEKPGTIKVKGV